MSDLQLPSQPTLSDYQAYIEAMVIERGFNQYDIAKKFVMLYEELGELTKAARKSAGMKLADNAAKTDVALEAADVFIVFIGLCNMFDIDLEQAFRDKEAINKQRTWK